MNEYPLTILFSILEEYIEHKRITKIKEWGVINSSKLVVILLDGMGKKEFRYLLNQVKSMTKAKVQSLVNSTPNTISAYKQIFHRGNESIDKILVKNKQKMLLVDNRAELSLFKDSNKKIVRNDDAIALETITNNVYNYDLFWLHLMSIDHAEHKGENIRHQIIDLAKNIETFLQKMPKNVGVIFFGDHGPHARKYDFKGVLSKHDKNRVLKDAQKKRISASQTSILIIEC